MYMCYKNFTPFGYGVLLATVKASNFKFCRQIGFGTSLPKNNVLDQNWRGSRPGEHPKKFGTPYIFLQRLKLATSNLVHKLGLALAYQKTTFWTKIGWSLGQGSIQKNMDPLHIFATVEASNVKFGTQIGFGTSLPKKRFGPKLALDWARGASKKNLGPPTYFGNR